MICFYILKTPSKIQEVYAYIYLNKSRTIHATKKNYPIQSLTNQS